MESVKRRTDNTMTKQERTKGQTTFYKHTHTTTDRVAWTPLKTGTEFRCFGRVSSYCCTTSDTCCDIPIGTTSSEIMYQLRDMYSKTFSSSRHKWLWLSYLGPLAYLPQRTFKLFIFPLYKLWTYLMKVIPDTRH
jgi:hypothetical protein